MFASKDVRFDKIDPHWADLPADERREATARELGTMMGREVAFETPAELLALLDEGIGIVAKRSMNPAPMDMVMGDTFTVVFSRYRAELLRQVPELAGAPARTLN